MICSSCEKPATQMFHFREEGQSHLNPSWHVPSCDLHSLKDRPKCAPCFCTETWEVLMEKQRLNGPVPIS
jgi:hypothetical protein